MALKDFFNRFTPSKRLAEQLPSAPPTKAPFLFTLNLSNLDVKPITSKAQQLDNYVGWVYGCVSTIGQDTRTNPWGLWRKTGKRRKDWTQVEKAPELMGMANATDTWGQLIERRNQHKDTTGEAWWHLISAAPGGRIEAIEMIQPDWIDEPIYDSTKTRIIAWYVNVPNTVARRRIESVDLVLDFYSNPRDRWRGASPIEAFALSHHLDLYLRAYGVKLIKDGGMVVQAITTDQDLTPAEADAIEGQLTRKFRTPGRIAVLGKGSSIETPGLPLKDLDFLKIINPSRDQILAIYKVPKTKFGLTEGAGDTNQTVATRAYNENCIWPRLMTWDEIVNVRILPRLGLAKDIVYESESPVDEDRDYILKKETEKFSSGASTVNQYLVGIGDEPVPDGDVRFIPSNVRVVKSFDEAIQVAAPVPQDPPSPSVKALAESTASRLAELALSVTREKPSAKVEIARLRKVAAESRFLLVEDIQERTLRSNCRRIFAQEDKDVRAALERNVKAASPWIDNLKAVFALHPEAMSPGHDEMACSRCAEVRGITDVPNAETRDWLDDALKNTADDWGNALKDAWSKGIETGAGLLQEEVAGAISFKVFEERAKRYAAKIAGAKVVGIQGVTLKELRKVIAKGIEKGDSVDKIAKAVSELYDGFKGIRSETIARTEVSNSIGWGKYEAAKESQRRLGMKIVRTWIATLDERTRPAHAAADGEERTLDENYDVGGFEMKHPGDSSAPAELVINCRCTETYEDVSE